MPQDHRQDRLSHEWGHSPYKSKHELPDPMVCPQCGVGSNQGRRPWLTRPEMAHEARCYATPLGKTPSAQAL
jgi:hypothetical protein